MIYKDLKIEKTIHSCNQCVYCVEYENGYYCRNNDSNVNNIDFSVAENGFPELCPLPNKE